MRLMTFSRRDAARLPVPPPPPHPAAPICLCGAAHACMFACGALDARYDPCGAPPQFRRTRRGTS